MALFLDIELVSVQEVESPDAYVVAFDVIYGAETWCRSLVRVDRTLAAQLEGEERAVVAAARDALLELLALELLPVSLEVRLALEGCTVLARGVPGGR